MDRIRLGIANEDTFAEYFILLREHSNWSRTPQLCFSHTRFGASKTLYCLAIRLESRRFAPRKITIRCGPFVEYIRTGRSSYIKSLKEKAEMDKEIVEYVEERKCARRTAFFVWFARYVLGTS